MNPEEIFQVSQGVTLSVLGNSSKWRNILPMACGTAIWLGLGARCQGGRFSALIRFCSRAWMIPSRNSWIVINHFWNGKDFICAAASGGTAIPAGGGGTQHHSWGGTPVTITLKTKQPTKKKAEERFGTFCPTGTLLYLNLMTFPKCYSGINILLMGVICIFFLLSFAFPETVGALHLKELQECIFWSFFQAVLV